MSFASSVARKYALHCIVVVYFLCVLGTLPVYGHPMSGHTIGSLGKPAPVVALPLTPVENPHSVMTPYAHDLLNRCVLEHGMPRSFCVCHALTHGGQVHATVKHLSPYCRYMCT